MYRFFECIRPGANAEIEFAESAEARGQFHSAVTHLERAHELDHKSTVQHVQAHLLMLGFALCNRRGSEVVVQFWRVMAAAVFTPVGLLASGNTGGTDASGFLSLPIPADLQRLIDAGE